MQDILNFKRKGIYNLKKHFDLNDEDEDDEAEYQINNFIISPNQKMIAVIITMSEHQPTCSSVYEYKIKIINVEKNKIIFESFWIDTDYDFDIFSQFSVDSLYFVYHSLSQISIIDLQNFKQQDYLHINDVYSLDDQNQIYLKKGNSLQILSIPGFEFQEILNSDTYFIGFLKIQKSLYFSADYEQTKLFWLQKKQNKIYASPNLFCISSKTMFNIMPNQLILIDFTFEDQNYIELRNTRNYRLLRNISNQNQMNCIQNGNNIYICQTNKNQSNEFKSFSRFNMMIGTQKIMKFILNKQNEKVYITNSILVDLHDDSLVLRYFSFDVK